MNLSGLEIWLKRALGLELGSSAESANNRLSMERLSWKSVDGNRVEFRIREVKATALRFRADPLAWSIESLHLRDLVGTMWVDAGSGALQAHAIEAGTIDVGGLTVEGPLTMPEAMATPEAAPSSRLGGIGADPAQAWQLTPLEQARGTLRAHVTDAQLFFDADVTVPIRSGEIDFNATTVEHVGPDSRMGISRSDLYIDAPNGRSYLYKFTAAPIAGVVFERRDALLGPWVSERGKLQLRPFIESALRQGIGTQAAGLTHEARELLGRAAITGDLRWGGGPVAIPGFQAEVAPSEDGASSLEISSPTLTQRLMLRLTKLSVTHVVVGIDTPLLIERMAGNVSMALKLDAPDVRFALTCDTLTLKNIRLTSAKPS